MRLLDPRYATCLIRSRVFRGGGWLTDGTCGLYQRRGLSQRTPGFDTLGLRCVLRRKETA